MKSKNCSHIELTDFQVERRDRRWIPVRSCENCIHAIRLGDNAEAIMWEIAPPDLNQIECQKNVQRLPNGQEIVEAKPGSDRYKAMAKYCQHWEDRECDLPPFSGKGPIISP